MREFAAALKLSREKGVGASTFRRLLDEYHLPTLAYDAWLKCNAADLALSAVSLRKSQTVAQIEQAMAQLGDGSCIGWYYGQDGYPKALMDLGEPPPVLFSTGMLPGEKFAAVVGSRDMVAEGRNITGILVEKLINEGYTIVSGGATGIDTVAHQTAIELGGKTIAVLATGLDVVYPAVNRDLFMKIREHGALITEMMPGTKPARSFFPTRNRLIAAIADLVVVIQADLGSGSLITASWAARLGRKILTVPPQADRPEVWAGNQKLIEAGAGVFMNDGRSAFSFAEFAADFAENFDVGLAVR